MTPTDGFTIVKAQCQVFKNKYCASKDSKQIYK